MEKDFKYLSNSYQRIKIQFIISSTIGFGFLGYIKEIIIKANKVEAYNK